MANWVNPYIAGAPVTEASMFFGREDVFQWIENSIGGQFADHILVIHGQRRVGKTSVLKQLGNRLSKRFIPVFFDLQGRTHTSLDHFLWWLAREIVRVLRQERGLELPPPDQKAFSADPEYFENQFLTGLRSVLGKDTLLLTFDEFDNLEESEVKEALARPLIDYLRRLMGTDGLNFIFSIGSSGRKLENMRASYTEFFKTALYKKISFLNEEQTHRLITGPVAGLLEYSPAAVDRIYRVTSGHPYFTQLVCHELFARCQRTEQRRIDTSDVEAILDDVVERGTVNLKFVWDESSDIEKWSLAALAGMEKTDNRALANFLQKQHVRFSEADLTSGLLHLREKDVLTPENRFVIHLLRLWLQKNRSIEQTREELTEVNPIANRLIEVGLEFRQGRQFDKALDYFRQALSVSAGNLQAQVNIAQVYMDQKAYDKAVVEFEKALAMDDEEVAARAGLCEAHLALGDAAMAKGRSRDAALSYERVLAINLEHTEARGRMAELGRQRAEKALTDGKDAEALSAFAEALKYTPEDPALIARRDQVLAEKKARVVADLLAQSEREASAEKWEDAVRSLQEALALAPADQAVEARLAEVRAEQRQAHLSALRTQARALARAGRFDEALSAWNEYLTLQPDDAEEARAEIEHVNTSLALAKPYAEAQTAYAEKDYDRAVKLLKGIIMQDENYKDASRLLTLAIELRRTTRHWWQSKWMRAALAISISAMLLFLVVVLLSNGNVLGSPGSTSPMPPGPTGTDFATGTPVTAEVTSSTSAAQIRLFADPILTAIVGRSPLVDEDFSYFNAAWPVGSTPNGDRWGFGDGGYSIAISNLYRNANGDPCMDLSPSQQFPLSDFVLQVDAQFVSDTVGNWHLVLNRVQPGPQASDNADYSINFFDDGAFLFAKGHNTAQTDIVKGAAPLGFAPGTGINRVTIIARRTGIAAYINEEPLFLVNDATWQTDLRKLAFGACNDALKDSSLQVRFDNLKVWDITGLSTTPLAPAVVPTPDAVTQLLADAFNYVMAAQPAYVFTFDQAGLWKFDLPENAGISNGALVVKDGSRSRVGDPTNHWNAASIQLFPSHSIAVSFDFRIEGAGGLFTQCSLELLSSQPSSIPKGYVPLRNMYEFMPGGHLDLRQASEHSYYNIFSPADASYSDLTQTHSATIILLDANSAVYVDGELALTYKDRMPAVDFQQISLSANGADNGLVCHFDNLRVFNLAYFLDNHK